MNPLKLQHMLGQAPANWDEEIDTSESFAGIGQSSFFADLRMDVDHAKIHFLQVRKEKELMASLLLVEKPSFRAGKNYLVKNITNLMRCNTRGWLEWTFGPAVFVNHDKHLVEALRLILEWIDEYASKERMHHVGGSFANHCPNYIHSMVEPVFQAFGYQKQLRATLLIDLRETADGLWRQLNPASRKSINKARRTGLTTRRIDGFAEFEKDFISSYNDFEQKAKRHPAPPMRMKAVWQHDRKKIYRFFVALSDKGKVLATLGMHYFNGVATEIASSMSPEAFASKMPAQDLLHWDMILYAKSEGCHTFDLAGISPNPADQKARGIRRFKEKWGGKYIEFPYFSKQFRYGPLDFLTRRK